MEVIASDHNQWIKKIKALQKKKFREQYQQFVVEGSRFCSEALKNKADIEALFISEDIVNNEEVQNLVSLYKGNYYIVKPKVLEKGLVTINPQGIAAIVSKPVWNFAEILAGKLFLIIDGVQDPGNLGTILRTALAVGVDGVFCLKGTVDLFNDKTLRSTMGAVFNLPVFYIEDEERLLNLLKQQDIKLVIADVSGQKFYYNYTYPAKVALVLGSEASGPQNIKCGDIKIKIPLSPKTESLNVAVAAGIILYEIDRQKRINL